jgi:S1-C subfamily serine protease
MGPLDVALAMADECDPRRRSRRSHRPGTPTRSEQQAAFVVISVMNPSQPASRAAFAALPVLLAWTCVAPPALAASEPDVRRDAVVQAVEKVMPSVVNIGTRTRVERRGYYYEWWRDAWAPYAQALPPQESAGSGVIIDEAGYVLTNVHVVEGADEVWVNVDGKIHRADPIIGVRQSDVALLKIRTKGGETFHATRFAADDDLLLGETVLALGNPFGLGGSVSRGILSSKSRRQEIEETESLDVPDWLQTDASINPGNSGGPLINLRGEVIGISVAVLKQAQGIGFAIPVKRVTKALSEIFTPEAMKELWFGARLKPASTPLSVLEIEPESPAARAGLQPGDQILSLDDKPVRSFMEFNAALMDVGDSRAVKLQVQRQGERTTATVRMVPEKEFFNADLIQRRTGLKLRPLTADLAESLGLSRSGGLVIAGIDRRSPASEARLEPGQVIRSVDGQAVSDLRELARRIQGRKAGSKVRLAILVEQKVGFFVRQGTQQVDITLR